MKYSLYIAFSLIIANWIITPINAQSPYKTSWDKDVYILAAGGISDLTGLILYSSIHPPSPEEIGNLHRGSVISFDRIATYRYAESADKLSDILYIAAVAAPVLLITDKEIKKDLGTITLMYIEVWSFIGGTALLSKGGITRYRPYAYNPDVPLNKKLTADTKMSFFSNHTTAAFASAVFISTVYSDYYPDSKLRPYIWTLSLLAAGTTGYLRYEAGMHYPTDIITGAFVGSAIGYLIPLIHRVNKNEISIVPCSPYAEYGISVQLKF